MKKLLAILLVLLLALAQVAVAEQKTYDAPELTFVFPEINADGGLVCDMLRYFAQLVNERSGNRIEIQVFGGAQLGTEAETVEMMLNGVTHFIRLNPANMSTRGIDIPEYTAMGLPFLLQSVQGGLDFLYSDAGKALGDQIVEKSDGQILSLYNYICTPARNMFTKVPVSSLADFAKLKVRSETSQIKIDMINCWASATPLAMSEIYTSLQTGVLDGCENTIAGYADNAWYELAPYVYETEHVVGASIFMISAAAWDQLTADEQVMMVEALREACDWFQGQQDDQLVTYRAMLAEKGVTFNACTDRQAWIDACAPLYETYAGSLGDFIAEIQSYK